MTDIATSHSLTSLIQLASASVIDYKMLDKTWAVRVTDPKTCNADEITGLNYFSSAAVKEIERYKFALCSVGLEQAEIEEGITFYHSQPGTWKEKLKAFLAVKRVALNKPRQPLNFRRRANRVHLAEVPMRNREKRGTGRTTRMVEHAIEMVKQGRAVYVMVLSHHYTRMLNSEYRDTGVKFETPDSLRNFDWEWMRLTGAHPNCVVLIDHAVIERRFAGVIEMLQRYDTPNGELDQHWLT